MAIPKGILKSTQDLRESLSIYNCNTAEEGSEGMRHVNFDSANKEEHFRSIDTLMDSHPQLKLADV
jgi:hypothetical protein